MESHLRNLEGVHPERVNSLKLSGDFGGNGGARSPAFIFALSRIVQLCQVLLRGFQVVGEIHP
jgi:hypothetical protein